MDIYFFISLILGMCGFFAIHFIYQHKRILDDTKSFQDSMLRNDSEYIKRMKREETLKNLIEQDEKR